MNFCWRVVGHIEHSWCPCCCSGSFVSSWCPPGGRPKCGRRMEPAKWAVSVVFCRNFLHIFFAREGPGLLPSPFARGGLRLPSGLGVPLSLTVPFSKMIGYEYVSWMSRVWEVGGVGKEGRELCHRFPDVFPPAEGYGPLPSPFARGGLWLPSGLGVSLSSTASSSTNIDLAWVPKISGGRGRNLSPGTPVNQHAVERAGRRTGSLD